MNDNATTVASLQDLQIARRHCIRAQSRSDRGIEHQIANTLGYHTGLPEAERKKLMKRAGMLRKAIEASMGDPNEDAVNPGIPEFAFQLAQTAFKSRQHWDEQRADIEADMMRLAKELSVWPWVNSVLGVGPLGLAVLVGEAGDISTYSGPGKLWKRLGLSCYDGQRQSRVPAGLTQDERNAAWKARGYNPARRAEVWAFFDDVMFRAQWRGAKDANGKNPLVSKQPVAVEAHAIGPYGEVYGNRKAWNTARGLVPAHADRDARRFMTKRFVRDLWAAWHTAEAVPQMAMAAE